jgi:hypothetical protein
LGGRKRTTTEEAKELALQTIKKCEDKYEVDRGHGVARALETVLLNLQGEGSPQEMSLVYPIFLIHLTLGFITSRKEDQRTITTGIIRRKSRRSHSPTSTIPQ